MFYFDTRSLIVVFLLVILFIEYLYYRKKIGQELVIAALFSLFITSYVEYIYSGFNVTIGRVNVFPLVSWTVGLVLLREVYERIRVRYKFIITSLIYIAGLFLLEYVGYYKLGVKLDWEFESLFGLGIIHGPPVIHIFYVVAGPLYLLVTDYLRVK